MARENPKPEIRNPNQIPMSKSPKQCRNVQFILTIRDLSSIPLPIWDLGFDSDFGLRISDFYTLQATQKVAEDA
jgi:hypothetical protein